jgi:hypothetical protein
MVRRQARKGPDAGVLGLRSLIWCRRYCYVETMLFSQLGRPENIIIASVEVFFADEGEGDLSPDKSRLA